MFSGGEMLEVGWQPNEGVICIYTPRPSGKKSISVHSGEHLKEVEVQVGAV